MHFTLHITERCNLNCTYCFTKKKNVDMAIDIAQRAIDLAARLNKNGCGIAFFGGEPLLKKQLIIDTVNYAKETYPQKQFHYKITTNGILLDMDFIDFAVLNNIYIAISIDGNQKAHDSSRVDANGKASHKIVEAAAKMLLSKMPHAPVMCTVSTDNVHYFADSVDYLYNLKFKYIICTPDFSGDWNEKLLRILKKQYIKLSKFYYKHTINEDNFYLSPFEVKISSHIHRNSYCHERCELGKESVSVACNGYIYPCVQFVYEEEYKIGDIKIGIDPKKQQILFQDNESEKSTCTDCFIKDRCNHYCACVNKQTTGYINQVSPVLCAHERIILPIADKVAEKLYKKRNGMFIQKHYNEWYGVLSVAEENLNDI